MFSSNMYIYTNKLSKVLFALTKVSELTFRWFSDVFPFLIRLRAGWSLSQPAAASSFHPVTWMSSSSSSFWPQGRMRNSYPAVALTAQRYSCPAAGKTCLTRYPGFLILDLFSTVSGCAVISVFDKFGFGPLLLLQNTVQVPGTVPKV